MAVFNSVGVLCVLLWLQVETSATEVFNSVGVMCVLLWLQVETSATEECCVSGDPRGTPARMNYRPGTNLNIFQTATFDAAGNVTHFDYYSARTGQTYLSIWRNIGTVGKDFQLVGKIQFEAYGGYQEYIVAADAQIAVGAGDMIGVHYGVNRTSGTIFYENDDRNLTEGIRLEDLNVVASTNVRDSGWAADDVITTLTTYQRAVALRVFTTCEKDSRSLSTVRPREQQMPSVTIGLAVALAAVSVLLIVSVIYIAYMCRKRATDSKIAAVKNTRIGTSVEPHYQDLSGL